MNISEELKDKAVSLGLCKEWTDGWGDPSVDDLVKKYIDGIDFCIEKDFPSNEYIKQNFGEVAEKHGVYVDKKIELSDPSILVLNGFCKGKINIGEFCVSTIYVRHNSDVEVEVHNGGLAFVHLYDDAGLNVQSKGKCFVYRHGGFLSTNGNIIVRDRRE